MDRNEHKATEDYGREVTTRSGYTPTQRKFYNSPQCEAAREALQTLIDSTDYTTDSAYYSNSSRNFMDRHLHYLSTHPQVSVEGYLSNLRLMTKIR